MARLIWGQGPPLYDLGLDYGVLYLEDGAVPWNGLVAVDENDSAEVNTDYYFDGKRMFVSTETGDFDAKISAYTYPDVFAEYNGYAERQTYRRFGFSYRTVHASSYQIHVVYNVLVMDGNRSWSTIKKRPDPSLFSWDIRASTIPIPGAAPASRLTLEVPKNSTVFEELQDILYGTDSTDARLPTPAELVALYEAGTRLRITYNGDGTYTANGPDDMVVLLGSGAFSIDAPTVDLIDEDTFVASSSL